MASQSTSSSGETWRVTDVQPDDRTLTAIIDGVTAKIQAAKAENSDDNKKG